MVLISLASLLSLVHKHIVHGNDRNHRTGSEAEQAQYHVLERPSPGFVPHVPAGQGRTWFGLVWFGGVFF